MTTAKERAEAAAREDERQLRADLKADALADEVIEAREDAAAARKVGAARVAPAPAAFAGEHPETAPVKAPEPVTVVAHFTEREVVAIEAALRDAAKDPAVYMLNQAILRGMGARG